MRYVPGRRFVHVNEEVAPAATSVASDCARGNCGGGVKAAVDPTVDHVTASVATPAWLGLGVHVVPPEGQAGFVVPNPPPTWPTIVSDVGTPLAVPVPAGRKLRLLVKLIVRLVPVAT